MNELVTLIDDSPVTTTLAIAEGTQNEHASVIKLVRTYQNDLEEFGRVGFEIASFETAGGMQQREVATLNEQQSTLLLTYMRNSDIVRAFKKRLVKEFWQMAKQLREQSTVDPMQILCDPATMRGLLLTYTEKVLTLESKVAEQAPKVAALDRITASGESLTLTQAAKVLGVKIQQLTTHMHANGWIYRQNSSWIGYDKHIKNGNLQYKEANYTDAKTSLACIKPYCHITQKGLTKLAEELTTVETV